MDGDIKKAYDFVSHKAFAEAAREKGISEILILAWLREWRNMKSIVRLDAETTSGEVERTRSLPQGDPAAPNHFNNTLAILAVKFTILCRRRKWGKELIDGTWVDTILFADSYWLVATSHKMLENMTEAWLYILSEVGWERLRKNSLGAPRGTMEEWHTSRVARSARSGRKPRQASKC
jgi:transposase-like protein